MTIWMFDAGGGRHACALARVSSVPEPGAADYRRGTTFRCKAKGKTRRLCEWWRGRLALVRYSHPKDIAGDTIPDTAMNRVESGEIIIVFL